ncbi:class I SAM-dependent methyltransferase [Streptomyces sp. NBC_01601]|uniref:class I SAM-dependent methyltransferase n=1 Tax=Streptomyces sp. NBC_01601 TaxID=2975892 RepID=UPI002E2BEA28|nr:class I SAM-dependent methyltransferase [Streptomyces sp. NBC_01601]
MEAADYARYRPGIPPAAVQILADTLTGVPDPTLLDLGSGTGQVPLALLPAVPDIAHIDLVDTSSDRLHQAALALQPLLGRCVLDITIGEAQAFIPWRPGRGPDLVTCCRAFHWMDRPTVLGMLDNVAAPNATVAIMGDGSLWTYQAEWTTALRELIQTYLGPGRRAGAQGTYTTPRRSHEEYLAESAFSDITEHHVPVDRAWTPESVIGYLRSTSFASPSLFAGHHADFEAAARVLLTAHAEGGRLVESTEFTLLLARRPAPS